MAKKPHPSMQRVVLATQGREEPEESRCWSDILRPEEERQRLPVMRVRVSEDCRGERERERLSHTTLPHTTLPLPPRRSFQKAREVCRA